MTLDDLKLYFAYGSNMDENNFNKRLILSDLKHYGRMHGELKGYKLEFNKKASDNYRKGYANITPDAGFIVEGVLYSIPNSGLKTLDTFEGVPYHYYRENIKVFIGNQFVNAVAYIANPNRLRKGLKPTKEYLQKLLAGRDLLSKEYYEKLLNVETLD